MKFLRQPGPRVMVTKLKKAAYGVTDEMAHADTSRAARTVPPKHQREILHLPSRNPRAEEKV